MKCVYEDVTLIIDDASVTIHTDGKTYKTSIDVQDESLRWKSYSLANNRELRTRVRTFLLDAMYKSHGKLTYIPDHLDGDSPTIADNNDSVLAHSHVEYSRMNR